MEKRTICIMIVGIVAACIVVAGIVAYFMLRELRVEVLTVQAGGVNG